MKKKTDLKKLALLGITGGIMLSSQASARMASMDVGHDVDPRATLVARGCGGDDGPKGGPKGGPRVHFRTDMGGEKKGGSCGGPGGCAGMSEPKEESQGEKSHEEVSMSEADLMSKLDYKGRQTYQNLDDEGKELARQLAGRSCAGHNECAGLNSCKSDENACAGEGGCKGQSGCSFKDKNQAIEVAAKKMAEKRANLHNR